MKHAETGTPLIIDTDVGGDPDDAIALSIAADNRNLALVITSDELNGERARFARHFLDLLGRPEVPVVAGKMLSDTKYFVIEDLTPTTIPDQSRDVLGAVASLASRFDKVLWIGMGPLSNLACVLDALPGARDLIQVVQMGGAFAANPEARAEHNFRLDPSATRKVLELSKNLKLVMGHVTLVPEMELDVSSPAYKSLETSRNGWASILKVHFDRWFSRFFPSSCQHDPLALSVALGLPFVELAEEQIIVDADGRSLKSPNGRTIDCSASVNYAGFNEWLEASFCGKFRNER